MPNLFQNLGTRPLNILRMKWIKPRSWVRLPGKGAVITFQPKVITNLILSKNPSSLVPSHPSKLMGVLKPHYKTRVVGVMLLCRSLTLPLSLIVMRVTHPTMMSTMVPVALAGCRF